MEEKKTAAQQLRLDLMDKCNCNNEQEVMFLCQDEQCPNREKQTFYCAICLKKNHKHMPLLISVEVDEQSKMWEDMREKVTKSYPEAEKLYIKYQPVIEYLEHSMMKH